MGSGHSRPWTFAYQKTAYALSGLRYSNPEPEPAELGRVALRA